MSFATELDWPHQVNSTLAARPRSVWAQHRTLSLRCAVAVMSVPALIWLGYESGRLLIQTTLMGAVDRHLRYDEAHAWFASQPVCSMFNSAVFPPPTHAFFWPFTGWLAWTPTRWIWALTTVGAPGWLGTIYMRERGAQSHIPRAFVLLIPLATHPVGATIGNGQLIILRIARTPQPGGEDVAAGLLLGLTLLFMLAPGGVFVLPYPLSVIYTGLESLLWLAMLAFLMCCARRLPVPAEVPCHGVPSFTPQTELPVA